MANNLSILISAIDKASEVFNDVGKSSNSLADKIMDNHKKIGGTMVAIGGAITAFATASIMNFSKTGEELLLMSQKTGMSVKSLSELKYMAEMNGSSLEGLGVAIRTMQSGLTQASDTTVGALNSLGVSLDDLQGKKPEEQFNILTTAIASIEDPTLRAGLATQIFGRSGTELLPILSGGTAGMEEMRKKASELGMVMDEEAATKADAFGDAADNLKGSLAGVMNLVATGLIPALQPLIELITNITTKVVAWMQEHPELTRVITILITALGALSLIIGSIILVLPTIIALISGFGVVIAIATGPVGLITLAIAALVTGIILLWNNWDSIWGWIQNSAQTVWSAIEGFFNSNWAWLLPGGAFIKALFYLKDNWSSVWNGMKSAFMNIINPIIEKINALIGVLNKIPGVNISEVPTPSTSGGTDVNNDGKDDYEGGSPYPGTYATGGIIPATSGGRRIIAGEGGESEAVIPLSKANQYGFGGGDIIINNNIDGKPFQKLIIDGITKKIKLQGGLA